jgi:hypothetical protein
MRENYENNRRRGKEEMEENGTENKEKRGRKRKVNEKYNIP